MTAARQRNYVKVSDDERELLIDLMEANDHITLKEACILLNLKYESAKAIWTIYRKNGRRHKLDKTVCAPATKSAVGQGTAILQSFDRTSEL